MGDPAWPCAHQPDHINPTTGLRLPTGGKPRDRIATPAEARVLVGALAPRDQAALALAVYAGLRLGELMALSWEDVDLKACTLAVRRAWDAPARQFVSPKSKAGTRTVPIMGRLGAVLRDHRVLQDHPRRGLLLPSADPDVPEPPKRLTDRMARCWREAGIAHLGFHEARHTAASLFIAAGLNAKTVSTYLGHANIATTFDRYGHLFPGSEVEARGLLDAYMDSQDG